MKLAELLEAQAKDARAYVIMSPALVMRAARALAVMEEALRNIEADCEADYPPSQGAIKYTARVALKLARETNNA